MRVAVWGKNNQSVFSPHGCLFCQISLSRSTILFRAVLSILGRNTRMWSGFMFRRRYEPPGAEGTAPIPRRGVQRPPSPPDERGPSLHLGRAPHPCDSGANRALPASCLPLHLTRPFLVWLMQRCSSPGCEVRRYPRGWRTEVSVTLGLWQSLGRRVPREGSGHLRVPVWSLDVSFKQGLVEHVWILPLEQTGLGSQLFCLQS